MKTLLDLPNEAKVLRAVRYINHQEKAEKPTWFAGLNSLRFFAAALVVVMHIHNNMGISKLPQLPPIPILFKGIAAVSFFFVLSGFLITYLLLQEQTKTNTINIRQFYWRRVYRIWPLYFLVVIFGAIFYWYVVPHIGLSFENDYSHHLAIFLYVFFMANVMNSLFHVGGILHILWSIAVEEQFYLFWAPLVKKCKKQMPLLIGLFMVLFLLLHVLNSLRVFPITKEWQAVLGTFQFHYMAIGAMFAWILYTKKEWLLQKSVFTNKAIQVVLLFLLLAYFLFYKKTLLMEIILPLPLGLLFGWLIINSSSNTKKIYSLDNKYLDYLGKISYGIYMLHMPVVYAVSFLFQKFVFLTAIPLLYFPLFFLLVFTITIAIASLSYKYIEQPILKKYKK